MRLVDLLQERAPGLLPAIQAHVLRWVPYPWRGSPAIRANLRLLDDSLGWTPSDFQAYQLRQIQPILQHAEAHVPYYRELFGRIGFRASELRTLEDLRAIPPITKEEVKAAGSRLHSEMLRPELVQRQFTGGSTGEPMGFFLDRERARLETSFFYWVWRGYGHVLGRDRVAFFKADRAPDPDRKVFARHDPVLNYMRFDSNYLSRPENFETYRKVLEEFRAPILFGYPSSIHLLARMWQRSGRPAPRFRLVLLASENVFAWQRDLIDEIFRPEAIFHHYGHSEQVALAFKLRDDERMQFVDLYGHVELIDEGGEPVTTPGRTGEIVGTGYSRYMPFLRYRTKDYASLAEDQAGIFPAGLVVNAIEGRLQEFIVTRDERLVSICTIGGYHFPEMRDLLHIQYFQREPGVVHLRFVESPGTPLTETSRIRLATAFEDALRGQVRLVLERVAEIPLTSSNKKVMLIQELDVAPYL